MTNRPVQTKEQNLYTGVENNRWWRTVPRTISAGGSPEYLLVAHLS